MHKHGSNLYVICFLGQMFQIIILWLCWMHLFLEIGDNISTSAFYQELRFADMFFYLTLHGGFNKTYMSLSWLYGPFYLHQSFTQLHMLFKVRHTTLSCVFSGS